MTDWLKWVIRVLAVLLLAPVILAAKPRQITVPLTIEEQRIFVDAQFTRKDGTLRTARLWVDTGTPDFQISKKLAEDLGMDLSGPQIKSEDGIPQIQVQLPGLSIGGLALNLQGAKPMVIMGPQNLFAGSKTEGNLPATILMHYQVVLDIPHRSMIVAERGSVTGKGKRVNCLVQTETGMVQMEATIDGQKYSIALDSGAPYSMLSAEAMQAWGTKHPDWPQIVGAAGAATFVPPRLLRGPMMRIPQIDWGTVQLKSVGVLGMDAEFVSWYSKKTAAPVIGFLAWNVLRAFRVTIDYPQSAVYFEREAEIDSHDVDAVGLAVAESRSGGFAIVAVVQKDRHPAVEDAQPGDKIVKINDLDALHADRQTIVDALMGKPGDARTLVLDRKGKTLTITAKVQHLI